MDPLTADDPPNLSHASLRASEHKEPGMFPEGEGATEIVRKITQVQPCCREPCMGG